MTRACPRFGDVRRSRGRGVQVDTLADFDHRLASGATSLRGWRIRAVDLRHRSAELGDLRVAGALFLGCRFAAGDAERVEARGAIVVPDLPVAPVDLHLDHLYRPEELYDAPTYADSLDARAYAWSQTAHDRDATMAKALHDHAVDVALTDWVAGRRLVGVMGGHALERGTAGLPGRGPPRAAAGRRPRGRHRRRPRRDGGREPRRVPGRPRPLARRPARGAGPAGRRTVVPPVGRRLGTRRLRGARPVPRRRRHPRHPDLVLRARTAQRAGDRDRQVRAQRRPRVGPPRGLPRGHRLPPRHGRHGPGGVPGRVRELLRRRVLGRADGAGGPDVLDRDPPRVAVARDPGPRPSDGAARPPRRRRGRGRGPVRG